MKRSGVLAVGAIVLAATVVVILIVRRKHNQNAALETSAQAPLETTRAFVKDVVARRFQEARAYTLPHAAAEIEQTAQDLLAAPLVSEQYVPIYRRVNSGETLWRVDAHFKLANGKNLYGQFSLLMQPDGSAKIDIWEVEDWPKGDFKLGDAIPPPGAGANIEWMPEAREISAYAPH